MPQAWPPFNFREGLIAVSDCVYPESAGHPTSRKLAASKLNCSRSRERSCRQRCLRSPGSHSFAIRYKSDKSQPRHKKTEAFCIQRAVNSYIMLFGDFSGMRAPLPLIIKLLIPGGANYPATPARTRPCLEIICHDVAFTPEELIAHVFVCQCVWHRYKLFKERSGLPKEAAALIWVRGRLYGRAIRCDGDYRDL
jgi:hypothetical protein